MIKQQAYKMLIDEKNHRTQAYEKFLSMKELKRI